MTNFYIPISADIHELMRAAGPPIKKPAVAISSEFVSLSAGDTIKMNRGICSITYNTFTIYSVGADIFNQKSPECLLLY